ncbi:MAG TPA: T9SS type A sorting domain-containing protein [Candidatus Kapabacteria bacterium]
MKLRHIILFFLLALASRESAATEPVKYSLDTLCDGWKVCITDDMPNGGIFKITIDMSKSNNIYLDSLSMVDIDGEIHFTTAVRNTCFRIYKINPALPTTVVIVTLHNNGDLSSRVYHSTVDDLAQIEYTPTVQKGHNFLYQQFDSHTEKQFLIRNLNSSIKDATITDIRLTGNNPNFSVYSYYSPLPAVLAPDSTSYKFWVAFHAKDVFANHDTLIIDINCYQQRIPLFGGINTPVISADDIDLGEVYVGESVCGDITVRGTGNLQLVLDAMDTTHGSANPLFLSSLPGLPRAIGSFFNFRFCYKPTVESAADSMVVNWVASGINPFLLNQMKDWSIIRGSASLGKVLWDKKTLRFRSDSTTSEFLTVNFSNRAPAKTFVKQFYISGKDSAEFRIHNSLSPLSNVTMLRNEADWFDIAYKPDMTKPPSERYADRHAILVAELNDSIVTVELIGTFSPLHVSHELAVENLSFSPNPVRGIDATLSFRLTEPKQLTVSVYDILGREVLSIPSQYYSTGSYSNAIGTSKLPVGSYILRVSDGAITKSISFRVVK